MASVAKRTWTHKGETKTAWVVRYTDQLGKRRLKTFDMKKEADKYRTKIEREIEKGIHTADSESITVRDAVEQYQRHLDRRLHDGKLRRATVKRYGLTINKYVTPHLGRTKLTALTAPRIQLWAYDLRSPPVNASAHATIRAVEALRNVISLAQRNGKIARNVIIEARPELDKHEAKKLQIPTKGEVRFMLQEATGYMRVLLHVAVLTGMRQGELLGLLWDDVDFKTETIHVTRGVDAWGKLGPTKTPAGVRDIPIAPTLVKMLKERRLATGTNKLNLVFSATRNAGTMLPRNFYGHAWRPLMDKIGLVDSSGRPKYHFHALRHFAASLLIEQGEAPKVIQTILGHNVCGGDKLVHGSGGIFPSAGGAKLCHL